MKRKISMRFFLLYVRVRTAIILRGQRRRAGLSSTEAAHLGELDEKLLLRYEYGLENPPLCVIGRLLKLYNASDEAILFFLCPSLTFQFSWKLKNYFRRSILVTATNQMNLE